MVPPPREQCWGRSTPSAFSSRLSVAKGGDFDRPSFNSFNRMPAFEPSSNANPITSPPEGPIPVLCSRNVVKLANLAMCGAIVFAPSRLTAFSPRSNDSTAPPAWINAWPAEGVKGFKTREGTKSTKSTICILRV